MSDLEEVDVEQQLKAAEESGDDTGSIVLSEKDDTDDEDYDVIQGVDNITDTAEDDMGQESDIETDDDKKYNIGDVVQLGEYLPEFGANQPSYQIKGITEEGKYMIQRLTDDGSEVSQPREVDFDMLSPVIPKSPSVPFDGPEVKDTDTSPPFIINKTQEQDDLEEISSDEDSDDEEYNEHMQKLENDINRDYLHEYHPETKQINYRAFLD